MRFIFGEVTPGNTGKLVGKRMPIRDALVNRLLTLKLSKLNY